MEEEYIDKNDLIEQLLGGVTTYQDMYSLISKIEKKAQKILAKEVEHKPKFDSAMLYDALLFLLENKTLPKEVFDYIAELYNKDEEWMKIAKNTQLKNHTTSEVAKAVVASNSETVKTMKQHKLDVKGAMTSSKTPNQSVRRMHKLITVSDRLDELEKRMDIVEQRQDTSEYVLRAMVETSLRDAIKQKALSLIQEGKLTRKEISEVTGLSVRTLANYAKELS